MQTSFFGNTVDASNAKPAGETGPVPDGWYVAALTEIDVEQKNWGLLAKVRFKVLEGDHTGRLIFDNMTLTHNTSAQAHDIGQGRLKAWCDAIGIPANLTSADPLLGKTVLVKVKVEQGSSYQDKRTGETREGKPQNRIETFKAYAPHAAGTDMVQRTMPAAAPQQAAPPAAAAQAAPAPGARGPMPWEKRA